MSNLRWQEVLILAILISLMALFVWLIVWVVSRMGTTTQKQEIVRCPDCAEQIRPEAKICRQCGRELDPAAGAPPG